MKYKDVKIGMEVIMTEKYSSEINKGDVFKILRAQSEEGDNSCFIVDHAGDKSFLAPFCEDFEPTDPDFVSSRSDGTALEILFEATDGNADYISVKNCLVAMKAYAKQVAQQALKDAADEIEGAPFFSEATCKKIQESVLKTNIKTP